MYVPRPFVEDDPDTIRAHVRRWPFATVITAGPLGLYASHAPLVLDEQGAALIGHLARANPQCADLTGPVLAVFPGPHAFVSSRWYREPERHVPTWNYVAVHARGRGEVLDDPLVALDLLMAAMQPEDPVPSGEAERDRLVERLSGAIVAFRIVDLRWEGKAKLSQNRDPEDQQRVVAALAASDDPQDRVVAALMRERR